MPRKTPSAPREPAYPVEGIYGLVSRDTKVPTDNREIVARLVDDSDFHEFKPRDRAQRADGSDAPCPSSGYLGQLTI
jgi:acetyl-CoA carboxylase carboxyltransferase component